MMGFVALLIVAFGATFACVWLLNYVPLVKINPFTKKAYSPRLFIVEKLLGPMDAGGIGISVGVVVAKKYFGPYWRKKFQEQQIQLTTKVLI